MDTMYAGSDGRYYSARELWSQYESGTWEYCAGDADGKELVETNSGDLLLLAPLPETRGAMP